MVSTGGVSAGAYDFVKDALDHLGADTKFWKVAMKPGKPVVFSRLRDRVYFGLPGNPVSCMVAFVLFVAPSIRRRWARPRTCSARGEHADVGRDQVERRPPELHPGPCSGSERRAVASPMPAQGSHVSTSMLGANGLAVLEAGVTHVEESQSVEVVLIGPIGTD